MVREKNATQAFYPPAAVKLEQINFKTVIITQWGLCPSSIQFTHYIMNIASFKSVQFACYQSSVTGIAARLACKVNNNNNKIVVFYFALSRNGRHQENNIQQEQRNVSFGGIGCSHDTYTEQLAQIFFIISSFSFPSPRSFVIVQIEFNKKHVRNSQCANFTDRYNKQ